MLRLQRHSNILEIEDTPALYWVGATILLLLFVPICIGFVRNRPETATEIILNVLVLICLLSGMVFWAKAPLRRTRFDANLQKVTISSRSILGTTNSEIGFGEIEGGAIAKIQKGDRGEDVFSIQLLLTDQRTIELTKPDQSDSVAVLAAIDEINEFLGLKLGEHDFQVKELQLD